MELIKLSNESYLGVKVNSYESLLKCLIAIIFLITLTSSFLLRF